MSGRVLPFFKPLFAAVVHQCNLCGKKCKEDEYQTETARVLAARASSGQYVFCEECDPHVAELTEKVSQHEARLDADYEKIKQKKMRAYTEELLEALKSVRGAPGVTPRQDDSSPHSGRPARTSPAPTSTRPHRSRDRSTIPGSIPNPKDS